MHGTHGVGVKSVDIVGNTKGEGSALVPSCLYDAKAWGEKRIRGLSRFCFENRHRFLLKTHLHLGRPCGFR